MEGRGDGRVVSYPHTDRRGSTVALARGGMAVETYAYDAFGRGRPDDGPAGYAFRYNGQRLDPWTESYHYKAREYAPRLGRFYQPDPALFVDGPNVYAYVGNSPWTGTDPTGMERRVVYQANGTTIVYIPLRLTGTGVTPSSYSDVRAAAAGLHASAGESPIIVKIVPDPTGSDPDVVTMDLSPSQDHVNYPNGQGEGINLATSTGHIDSSRGDDPEAVVHDSLHAGRNGNIGAIERYTQVVNPNIGRAVGATANPNDGTNIMGTTSGIEITNGQVTNEIAPQSDVCTQSATNPC